MAMKMHFTSSAKSVRSSSEAQSNNFFASGTDKDSYPLSLQDAISSLWIYNFKGVQIIIFSSCET